MTKRDRKWLVILFVCLIGGLIAKSYIDRRQREARFFMAAASGNIEEVRTFVEEGIDLEFRITGGTPLMFATLGGHIEVIEILIEAGADPRAPVLGGTPLVAWVAARAPSAAFLKVLDACETFDANGMLGGESILYSRLVRRGKNSRFHGLDDDTPSIKRLLDEGADPNSTGTSGPLLFAAIENRTPEVVRLLCDAGADPNRRDSYGSFPLHWAITNGLGFVEALVENGADPALKDDQGRTPLDLARWASADHSDVDLMNVIEYLEAEQESRN